MSKFGPCLSTEPRGWRSNVLPAPIMRWKQWLETAQTARSMGAVLMSHWMIHNKDRCNMQHHVPLPFQIWYRIWKSDAIMLSRRSTIFRFVNSCFDDGHERSGEHRFSTEFFQSRTFKCRRKVPMASSSKTTCNSQSLIVWLNTLDACTLPSELICIYIYIKIHTYIHAYIYIYVVNNNMIYTSILVLCTHPLAWYLISLQFRFFLCPTIWNLKVVLGWGHWPTNRMDKKQSTASTSASLVENTPVEFDSLELHRVGWIMWTPNLNNHRKIVKLVLELWMSQF